MNARAARVLAYATGALCCLATIAAAVFAYLAIWTNGADSGRWGGSSFLTFVVAIALGGLTAAFAIGSIE